MKPILSAIAVALALITSPAQSWSTDTSEQRTNTIKQALTSTNAWLSTENRDTKYSNMSVSPFVFYRGSAHLYYQDMAAQSSITASPFHLPNAITWIQGDMHAQNMGAFADDNNEVIFDVNDFDEAWIGSYLYDVYRAAASVSLVAREQGFGRSTQQRVVEAFTQQYLDQLELHNGNASEKDTFINAQNAYGRLDEFLEDVERSNSRKKMLDKWTNDIGSQRKFDLTYRKLGAVSSSERSAITAAIAHYVDTLTSHLNGDNAYFKVLDVARRLNAGTGSLGTPRFYILVEGPTSSDNDDIILDVKQQNLPSIYPYLTYAEKQRTLNVFDANEQGCRVAEAQRAMRTNVDDHLGCSSLFGASFSIRERSPFKESFDTTVLTSEKRLTKLATQWASVIATAHARADKDHNAAQVSENLDKAVSEATGWRQHQFIQEVTNFAEDYADQVTHDYQVFLQLRREGKLD